MQVCGLNRRSKLFRTFFAVVGLVVLLAIAGRSYQSVSSSREERHNPEPGRLVDIEGLRLNIHCTGDRGPTVVLETGLGGPLTEWGRVQPQVARFARVCSYDRAGYGRSDAGPLPRTSDRIADELHALLRESGEPPPYVLVGHSFGGYNVRVFNGRYRKDVAAIVLVDATHEDQYELLPPAWNALGAAMLERYQDQARWAPISVEFGVTRLLLSMRGIEASHLILQTKYLRARASELEVIQVSAEQARAAGSLGDKPLIVLTAGKTPDPALAGGLSQEEIAEYRKVWVDDLQLRLAGLSERGKRILIPEGGHDMPTDRPDAITEAVREVSSARRTR